MSYTLDNWDVTENGSGTVSRSETNNGGSYSADLYNAPGGGNTVRIQQSQVIAVGTKVRLSFDVRCDTTDRTIGVKSFDPAGSSGTLTEDYAIVLADTWYTKTYEFTWGANDNAIHFNTNSNGHFYIDNVKLETMTASSDTTATLEGTFTITATL